MKRKKFVLTDLNHLGATLFRPFATHTLDTAVLFKLNLLRRLLNAAQRCLGAACCS